MYDEKKVEEALELCEDIKEYYEPKKKNVSNNYGSTGYEKRKIHTVYVTNSSEKKKGKKKESCFLLFLRNTGSLLLCILIAYGAARMITDYFIQITRVEGISMEKTLMNDDILLINKFDYRFHNPKRFDVVIFPYSMNEYYVKRVIGLPGETIYIEDGVIYIDEKPLPEQFGWEKIMDSGNARKPIKLKEDEFYLLGDNRNHSSDSRSDLVGPIQREKIIGRVWFRIYPFTSF